MKRFIFIILFLLSGSLALAQNAGVTPPVNSPSADTGTSGAAQAPGEIVRSVYDLALMVGGLLAFGAIVFGAIKYTLAAGNPSGQHEGKEWITQALLGLLLLVGATLVLKVINPDLITLKLPGDDVMPRLKDAPNTNKATPKPTSTPSNAYAPK